MARKWISVGSGVALILGLAGLAFVFEGFTPHAFVQAAWSLTLPALIVCMALAKQLQARIEQRDVELTSTERERAQGAAPRHVSRARHIVATAPLALVIAAYVVRRLTLGDVDAIPEALGIAAVVGALVGIGVLVRHVYETWRARRNAKLELQWEKWLDSADSCEVGPRKWTK